MLKELHRVVAFQQVLCPVNPITVEPDQIGVEPRFWPGMLAIAVAMSVGIVLGRLVSGLLFRPSLAACRTTHPIPELAWQPTEQPCGWTNGDELLRGRAERRFEPVVIVLVLVIARAMIRAMTMPKATLSKAVAATAMAKALKTTGITVYDFTLGEPEFSAPVPICNAAKAAHMLSGVFFPLGFPFPPVMPRVKPDVAPYRILRGSGRFPGYAARGTPPRKKNTIAGTRVLPAMAAGVVSQLWNMEDLYEAVM